MTKPQDSEKKIGQLKKRIKELTNIINEICKMSNKTLHIKINPSMIRKKINSLMEE